MHCRFLFFCLFLTAYSAKAQFVVLTGTKLTTLGTPAIAISSAGNVNLGDDNFDLANAKLLIDLNGANLAVPGIMVHSHTARILLDELSMSGTDYELRGTWLVNRALTLTNGKLAVKNTAIPVGRLIYTGNSSAVTASSSSYVIGPMFTAGNSQARAYPIGNANGYYPAQLSSVTDATALLRMECISSSASTAPITITQLTTQFPAVIDSLVTDRYYDFKVFNPSANFSGVPISLSLNGTQIDFGKHIPSVVELDTTSSTINNLQGSPQSNFILSAAKTTSYGGKYMIATSKEVEVKIHKLITPNGDGFNDELFIEGIDLYSINKVTLLDRWGGEYLTVQNFKNGQAGIDYTKLVNGNYICVVEYTDTKGNHKPKPQMITVLK